MLILRLTFSISCLVLEDLALEDLALVAGALVAVGVDSVADRSGLAAVDSAGKNLNVFLIINSALIGLSPSFPKKKLPQTILNWQPNKSSLNIA